MRLTADLRNREAVIAACIAIDPNGCYSDDDMRAEGWDPMGLGEALECLADLYSTEHTGDAYAARVRIHRALSREGSDSVAGDPSRHCFREDSPTNECRDCGHPPEAHTGCDCEGGAS